MNNNLKTNMIIAVCLILCSSFYACSNDDKDDIILETKPKEENIHWGYFKGVINKKDIVIENLGYPEKIGYPFNPIHSNMKELFYLNGADKDPIIAMPTDVDYEEDATIVVYMCDMMKGVRYLTNSYLMGWNQSRINLYFTKKESETERVIQSRYVTKGSNPFRVEILDVVWLDYKTPIIDVEIEGTLYNEVNLTDSIIISATYGTR